MNCVKEFREVCYYIPEIRQGYFITSTGEVYKLMKDTYLRKTLNDGSKTQTRIKKRVKKELGDMLEKGLSYTPITVQGFEHYQLILLRDGRLLRKMSACLTKNIWTDYLYVNLPKVLGEYKFLLVHRLVAKCYIGEVEGKEVHHIDFDPLNNGAQNLKILSKEEHQMLHLEAGC